MAAAFMSSNGGESDADKNVERWKVKKLIKSLEAARGCVKKAFETRSRPQANKGGLPFAFRNGTSMISLIIPPKDQISRVSKMLADEFGTASNIKSRVNR